MLEKLDELKASINTLWEQSQTMASLDELSKESIEDIEQAILLLDNGAVKS